MGGGVGKPVQWRIGWGLWGGRRWSIKAVALSGVAAVLLFAGRDTRGGRDQRRASLRAGTCDSRAAQGRQQLQERQGAGGCGRLQSAVVRGEARP